MNYIVQLMIVVLIVEAKSAELQSHFKLCPRRLPNYIECISAASTEAIISMANGSKSFKILPLEPLAVDAVSIGKTGDAVSVQQNYKNIKIHGITKGLKVQYDPIGTDKLVFRSNNYNDQIDFVADYSMEGKILLLPIKGNGFANITMLGLNSRHAMYCENYEKNGETYLRVRKYEIKFSPKKVLFHFTNLFNGDPILSERLSTFFNENSDVVFRETQGPFEEILSVVFQNIANNVFSRVPSNKLFPE